MNTTCDPGLGDWMLWPRPGGYTRSNDDGFKGEYPTPLDWGRIEAEIRGNTDTEEPSKE